MHMQNGMSILDGSDVKNFRTNKQIELLNDMEDDRVSDCCGAIMEMGHCLSCLENASPVNTEKYEVEERAMRAEEDERLNNEKKYV